MIFHTFLHRRHRLEVLKPCPKRPPKRSKRLLFKHRYEAGLTSTLISWRTAALQKRYICNLRLAASSTQEEQCEQNMASLQLPCSNLAPSSDKCGSLCWACSKIIPSPSEKLASYIVGETLVAMFPSNQDDANFASPQALTCLDSITLQYNDTKKDWHQSCKRILRRCDGALALQCFSI